MEEEGEVFRKGTVLLGPEEMEGEYDGEELRREVCVLCWNCRADVEVSTACSCWKRWSSARRLVQLWKSSLMVRHLARPMKNFVDNAQVYIPKAQALGYPGDLVLIPQTLVATKARHQLPSTGIHFLIEKAQFQHHPMDLPLLPRLGVPV